MDELLTGLYLLKGATDEDLAAVRAIARPRAYAAQEMLFSEDETPRAMYLIKVGKFDVFKGPASIASIGPGDVIGELAFFDDAKRSASARALEKSDVIELAYADLRTLMSQRPSLAVVLLQNACTVMATRLRRTSSDLSWLNAFVRS